MYTLNEILLKCLKTDRQIVEMEKALLCPKYGHYDGDVMWANISNPDFQIELSGADVHEIIDGLYQYCTKERLL